MTPHEESTSTVTPRCLFYENGDAHRARAQQSGGLHHFRLQDFEIRQKLGIVLSVGCSELWFQNRPLEDSPSGLWRRLGKAVGCKPSGVRIPYPPQAGSQIIDLGPFFVGIKRFPDFPNYTLVPVSGTYYP